MVDQTEGKRQVPEPLIVSGANTGGALPGDARPEAAPPTGVRRSERQESQWHKPVRILTLLAALSIAAMGLLLGGAGALIGLLSPAGSPLEMITISVSFLALSVGLGLALAWQAWQALARHGSGPFRPRRILPWALLFVVAVLLGQSVLSLDLLPELTFPPFHVAATILPPLVILAFMGRSLNGAARWRDVVLELASGAFLSTLLAFTLEFVAILGALVIGLSAVMARPGGVDLLQSLAEHLQDPAWLQTPANAAPLFNSPLLLAAMFLLFAGAIPLIEEAVKTLGVGLLAYRRPSLPQAVLWGLACGAGFALAEALFNSTSGMDVWAGVVLLRVGASLLHCFTGGLMGLAWYYLLSERRWRRTFGLYAASVGVHGLWNALAAGMVLVPLPTTGQELAAAAQGWAGLGNLVILAMLLLLALGVGVGLVVLARYARRHAPASKTSASSSATLHTQEISRAGADRELP
jgi:hypothetical protein